MYNESYKKSHLWNLNLEARSEDPYEKERERLRVAFYSFRRNVEFLVGRVSSHFPNLTQHDISHLDALWGVGSLLCGEEYPVNPMEAFVFGCSVLLHDSALCFEAYEGGATGIRESIEWKDAFEEEKCLAGDMVTEEMYVAADFAAVRNLHAEQARSLPNMSWSDPTDGQEKFLIEDPVIRKHYGGLIGEIASSHHWDIEKVVEKITRQFNSHPDFPQDWSVNGVKVACMLRCSDAAHITNERAPDFLHALIKRSGISLLHWCAQNKLGRIDIDQQDKKNLIFSSTSDFTEVESDAWWVAYDAACLLDKEIKSANLVLAKLFGPDYEFSVKGVQGVDSPEAMKEFVRVRGWIPCSANIHVGNVEGLIRSLGGEKLYGQGVDKLEVVLRELIQNARDSVVARQNIEEGFVGKITIRVRPRNDVGVFVSVDDDGVGMSERVIAESLLDFGTSFWGSSLVKSEFPGLRASGFKSIGQFGIGFYSVFMVADQVKVTSRRWSEAISSALSVKFNNGVSLRPLIGPADSEDASSQYSTRVSFLLKSLKNLEKVEIKRNRLGEENFFVNFSDYVAAICAGLDVPVWVFDGESPELVHPGIKDADEAWLKRISFSKYQDENVGQYIERNFSRLREIVEGDKKVGFAAISTCWGDKTNFMSVSTVGGLASSVHSRDSRRFIGYMDYLPRSAKRDRYNICASDDAIRAWAANQVDILMLCTGGMGPVERCYIAYAMCDFHVDPLEIANVLVLIGGESKFLTFDSLAQVAESAEILFIKSVGIDHFGVGVSTEEEKIKDNFLVQPVNTGNFLSLKMKGGRPEDEFSLLGCLFRAIEKRGKLVSVRKEAKVGKSSIGETEGWFVSAN